MDIRVKNDRVAETTTTTGTGTYDLAGAKAGFVSFNSRMATNDTCFYCCRDGTDWETGLGTFTDAATDTLARTTIIESSNSDAAVSWSAGTRDIFITAPASRILDYDGTDLILRGKMDIGGPGSVQGLDIGEGGSYSLDTAGATIVKAFTYDASASSGSRFTELTITANNTILGDNGDRLYFGTTSKFWAARVEIGVANSVSTETFTGFYWNGSALTSVGYMGVLKDSSTSLSDRIMEQTAEKEYIAIGREANTDWATADNQTDTIPNTGTALYWFCLQVPAGGLTTVPRIDEIKVRGTDTDFATGTAHQVHWGMSRVGKHIRIPQFIDRSAAQPSLSDESFSANVLRALFKLRNSQSDGVDISFRLPAGVDTSCKLEVELDWFPSATGEVDIDLYWKILTQGTVVGVGESDTGTTNTLITPSAAAAYQSADPLLTAAQRIDISAYKAGDVVLFTLVRDGAADANAGDFFPIELVVHYTEWTLGELV